MFLASNMFTNHFELKLVLNMPIFIHKSEGRPLFLDCEKNRAPQKDMSIDANLTEEPQL
ncbi:hypothetical protein JOC76_005060 [Neobacillus cucumis]|nr:hypothetical protein [Neobacillus cucumis]